VCWVLLRVSLDWPLIFQLISAGVVHVVLSALETHGMSNAIVNSCVKTLMIFEAAEIVDAANELRSVDTIISIAKRSMRFPEILSNILDLFMVWSANAEMAELLVDVIVPFALTMVSNNSGERNLLVLVGFASRGCVVCHHTAPFCTI
jgi:hypothetical protein